MSHIRTTAQARVIRAGILSRRKVYNTGEFMGGYATCLDLAQFHADQHAWGIHDRNPHTQEARARTKPFSQTRSR